MPCGWVLLWLMLSQCPKAGCCHGLSSAHALRLGVLKGNIRILEWYHAAFLNQKLRQDCLKQLLAPPAVFESSAKLSLAKAIFVSINDQRIAINLIGPAYVPRMVS